MSKVYAYQSSKTTATGKPVFAFIFAHESNDEPNYEVANLTDLVSGDDTWANVLEDNADIVIVNEQGQIDVDREALAQRCTAAAEAQQQADAEPWKEEDGYIDDGR